MKYRLPTFHRRGIGYHRNN